MIHRWVYKSLPEPEKVNRLSGEININPILSSILIQRGIGDFEASRAFFRPSLNDLHDPFLMKDMEVATQRLEKAIQQKESIMIYGDYDVDGTTSVALVYNFIKQWHDKDKISYYIPDRYGEGYGISRKGIDWAAEKKVNLIISLDCGIMAIEMAEYATLKGIDLIICDHHLPGKELPQAYAILNPKRKDCPYPYRDLSGCGVGFKLMQAYCRRNQIEESILFEFLDLLAVSIASDIVPVDGENRIFSYYGLEKLNTNPRPGIKALIDVAGLRGRVTISSIVFGIGPRINAAGRMSHAGLAVDLLLTDSFKEAQQIAEKINTNNEERRNYDASITQEAIKMIENDESLRNAKSTVLYKSDWHKGVIGIVASRCIDRFYRPTIILTHSNGKATGSARSIDGFDVYQAIAECSDLLEQFGGHMYAAGLTMDIDNVESFRKKFEHIVEQRISEEQLIPRIEIDQVINLDVINYKFFEILKQMAPFGPSNMQPVFVSEDLYVNVRPRILKDEHLKFSVKQEGSDVSMEAIGFGLAKYFELIDSRMRFKMAYTIEENEYLGLKSLQLYVKDLKFD